ncbi:hypothetical protein RhiJN_10729 [Ceratobasidium sp. AG-Ba]|nr:hypothetical protein RhiJN_10729 [Ceratobasidium sp. AG-Ba]QRW11457.1 hypothetical protein RhiLY_10456 [Ceratobasidium sp. AG-Ba]
MSSHRRTTSESISATYVFQPHPLSFAGANEENDNYFAAQRYDWNQVPSKLTEPRAPYEPTQPFDYALPAKKGRGKALSVRNETDGDDGAGRRRIGRPRREAQENHSPAVSVEPDGVERHGPKRRGRPPRRVADTPRKTDDGDNSEDESYVQPNETWKAGTKRRGSAPQHPPKRARISRTVESDDDQETGPLRSGGARSRATPIKPQQANRWSATEDRQLIDSLFEVLGSIPWRRVTAYMTEKGFPCADRGEGAIRGRWKVLRPRLYIAPPTVVRGAAAKSQLKARERAAEEDAEDMDVDITKDAEHDDDPEQDHHQPGQQEHLESHRLERLGAEQPEPRVVESEAGTGAGGGDTTAEDDDVAVREEEARGRERKKRKVAPLPQPGAHLTADGPPTPPSIPPVAPASTLGSIPAPVLAPAPNPARTATQSAVPDPPVPPRSPPPPFQHSTPNIPREPRTYSSRSPFAPPLEQFSISPGRDPNSPAQLLSSRDQLPVSSTRDSLNRDHGQLSPNREHLLLSANRDQQQLSPRRDPQQLSPAREAQTSPRSPHKLPTLSQILSPPPAGHYMNPSPIGQYSSGSPPAGHYTSHSPTRLPASLSPNHLPSSLSPTHLPIPLHQHPGADTRQLPPPQPFVPHSHTVWPARPAERTYEGERSYEGSYERERAYDRGSGSREYQVSGERGGTGEYTRQPYTERPYVPPAREETTNVNTITTTKSRKPLPEMLPFPLPARAPYQAYSTQVFSRLPVLGERTPSPKRKKRSKTSSQEEEVVPDSTTGSSDGM